MLARETRNRKTGSRSRCEVRRSSRKCRKCAHDNMRRLVYLPFQPSPAGLLCDRVSVHSIVEAVGTPAYVYSAEAIRSAFSEIDSAFAEYPHAIHYALKANSTLALLRLLRSLGSRVDANSWGEIQVAQRAGFDAERHRVYRRGQDARRARVGDCARRRHDQRRVGRRAGPHCDDWRRSWGAWLGWRCASIPTSMRAVIPTSPPDSRPTSSACPSRRRARSTPSAVRLSSLRFVGVHVHIGSQITTAEPLARAARVAGVAGAGAV